MQQADIKLIIGRSGSGKTYLANKIVSKAKRLIIFDTLGHDYNDGVIFYDLKPFKDFWLKHYKGNFRIIYRPLQEVPEFIEICKLVYACGNLTFLVDELDLFCPHFKVNIEFTHILKRGRHRDISFVGVTQRPIGIDKTVTSQANHTIIFRNEEPRDLQYISSRFSAAIAERVKNLKQYHYLLINQQGISENKH